MSMADALTLAIPSKGRLQEQVRDYFADAGIALKQAAGARGYRARLSGLPSIDVILLSASEIATALAEGDVHMGVTGEDLIRETAAEAQIVPVMPLGFGFANVVVAVPQAWIDVSTMADLDDVCAAFYHRHRRRLRVATKYVRLTRGFFARVGISDYRIVESLGATEGAPAAGTADAIVDITTTGATLAANGLKMLEDGTILESQAQLAASRAIIWKKDARAAVENLLSRLAARERAKACHVLRVHLEAKAAAAIPALEKSLGISVLSRSAAKGGGEFSLLCPRGNLMSAVTRLREAGCDGAVTAEDVEYVFVNGNPIYAALSAQLKR